MFVKKGDKVKVITGKDKNKEGVVLAAFPKQDKVIVEVSTSLKNTKNQTKQPHKVESLKWKRQFMFLM